MSVKIPASPSLPRKQIVPLTDPFHQIAGAFPPATTTAHTTRIQQATTTRAPVGGDYDAEAMAKLGADVPEAVHSRPTVPGGMVPAAAFLPGGHQPGAPGGRGGQGSVPFDVLDGGRRPSGGPPYTPDPSWMPSPSAPGRTRPDSAAKLYASGTKHQPAKPAATYTRETAQALRDLHTRFRQPPDETRAAAPVTLAQVNAARRHMAEARCVRCSSFLHGLRAGASGARMRVAQEQTAHDQAEAQEAYDQRLLAKQPNEYIAAMARRARTPGVGQAIAVANVERTALAQRPTWPTHSRW
jgi:hypothetical protein